MPSLLFPCTMQPCTAALMVVLLATGILAGNTPALSQEADDEEQAVIEEIVVTSRKREESLQEVPISVSVFSADDMEMKSLTSLKGIGQFTPNFSFFNHGQFGRSAAVVYIRGIGQEDPNIFKDPGVGIYVDGVYMGRMQGVDIDLMDLERVEILRGPQGTLFGKNTTGGAVNVVTERPGDEFATKAQVTTGRFDRIDGKLSVNIPLVPGKLAMKLAGATRNRHGYGQRLDFFTGNQIDRMGNQNKLSGRALIDWTPTPDLDVLLSVDGTRVREQGPVRKVVAFVQAPLVGLLNMFVNPPYGEAFATDSDFTTFSNKGNANDLDVWGIALTVNWDLGGWAIKSITSYRDMTAKSAVDPDGSIYDIIDFLSTIDQNQFSQELQVSGLSFDDRLNWVFGLYYFQEDASHVNPIVVYGDLRNIIGLDISFTAEQQTDNKSYAAFGQGTLALTDKLSFTGGLRFTDDKKDVARSQIRQFSGLVLVPFEREKKSFQAVSGRAGIEYQWTEDVMTYVSVARGFKSGGINWRSLSGTAFKPFKPEFVWTYEAGLRSTLLERRLRFNGTFFYSDYRDIQFTVVRGDPETGEPTTVIDNAARARIKGFEIEAMALPAPGLVLTAGAGLTDAEYTRVDPGAPITVDSKFVKTPKWTVTLSGQYTVPAGNAGQVVGRLDWVYKSKIHHDALNSPFGLQKGYSLLNARLVFESAGGNWSIALFATNLTDERYILAATDLSNALGFAEVQWAPPREWGLSLSLVY